MVTVRPHARAELGRSLLLPLAAVALLATGCATRADKPAASDTLAAASRDAGDDGASPAAHVAEIPTWPADTAAVATDDDARIPEGVAGSVPSCGAATPAFSVDSVGPLYPGMPLANLFALCKNPLLLWHSSEGVYRPAIAVRMGSALLLLDASGTSIDDVVARIIGLSGVRTAEGVGPGSPVADAARAYGEPTWTREQCGVTAGFASHLGLAVHVDLAGAGGDITCDEIHKFATGTDFSHFPRGSKIAWISAELGEGD